MSVTRHRSLLVFFALVAAALVVVNLRPLYLHYIGYCVEKSSFLTDRDALITALRSQAREIEGLPESPSERELEVYAESHPGCCIVLNEATTIPTPLIDRLGGFKNKWVGLLYNTKGQNPDAELRGRDVMVAVLPCGSVGERRGTLISSAALQSRLDAILQKNGRAL